MSFGGQTVTFVTITQTGAVGYLGLKSETKAQVPLPGCLFRPVSTTETPEGETDTTNEVWKLTAPPEASALAVKSTGELLYNSDTFQIDGPVQPKYDLSGSVHHVTIMCKRSDG